MTINIALVTNEAVVLGCDSIASVESYFLDPWAHLERDDQGNYRRDADGKWTAKFEMSQLKSVITAAWGGVTKMFELHTLPTPTAAITAGVAKLNNETMATIAQDFAAIRREVPLETVEAVANEFLAFVHARFTQHYDREYGVDYPAELRQGPSFLVGGFDRHRAFPSLYRLTVGTRTCVPVYREGSTGIAWAGQSDAVERLLFGCDTAIRDAVHSRTTSALAQYRRQMGDAVAELLNRAQDVLGQRLPPEIETELPTVPDVEIPWREFGLAIDFANLPLQRAIDLVSFLVLIQAARHRFAEGVATVGGHTHIGILRKSSLFKMLDEPELVHRIKGFGDVL